MVSSLRQQSRAPGNSVVAVGAMVDLFDAHVPLLSLKLSFDSNDLSVKNQIGPHQTVERHAQNECICALLNALYAVVTFWFLFIVSVIRFRSANN